MHRSTSVLGILPNQILSPLGKIDKSMCATPVDESIGRAKNAAINIWNVHDPKANPNGPPVSDSPVKFDYNTAWDQADLTSLDWNQDGTLLAAGSYDAVLRICDTSGKLYFTETMQKVDTPNLVRCVRLVMLLEKGPVFATRFSKSGQYLLTASLDGTVCVWDVQKKIMLKQYLCHDREFAELSHSDVDLELLSECCLDVEWLSDDSFVSAGADAKIQVLRLDSDKPLKTLRYVVPSMSTVTRLNLES